jgi:hypothetical protein
MNNNPFRAALNAAPDASTELAAFLTDHAARWDTQPRWHSSTSPFRQVAGLAAPSLVGRLSLRQELSTYISHFDAIEREQNDCCRTTFATSY